MPMKDMQDSSTTSEESNELPNGRTDHKRPRPKSILVEKRTSESVDPEDGEVSCPCAEHPGTEVINISLPMNVDYVFSLLFDDDNKFIQEVQESRKTSDFVQGKWESCSETGDKIREHTYTLTLNSTFAKTSPSVESQRLIKTSTPGQFYLVETILNNSGVPYSDSYCLKSMNCLTRISSHQCRYRLHTVIFYKKSVWGIVKGVIDKNAMQGLISFGADLKTALKAEAQRIDDTLPVSLKRKSATFSDVEDEEVDQLQTTKRTTLTQAPSLSPPQETPLSVAASILKPIITSEKSAGIEMLLKIGVAVLLLVLGMNCILFLKLWSLEDMSVRLSTNPNDVNSLPLDRLPTMSQQDFVRLLKQQEALHRVEIEKWRESLTDVLSMFQAMEGSLSNLQKVVDSYSTSRIIRGSFSSKASSEMDSEEFEKS